MTTKNTTNTYFYYAVIREPEDGRRYAYADRISGINNIIHAFPKDATAANPCPTKKQAEALADFWNECFRANGSYYFN